MPLFFYPWNGRTDENAQKAKYNFHYAAAFPLVIFT